MKRIRSLLDEHDAREFGVVGEPQLDDIIAPIITRSGKALDYRGATACPNRNEAARMHRRAGIARQVNDLDRSLQDDAGRGIEDKPIGEKRQIE
jgi:hypothetical protein